MRAMTHDVAGAVLVGGESRRMGRDKARLPLAGVALAARALGVLRAVLVDVALVTGQERDYSDLDGVQIRDRFPGAGPLAGLEAACAWAGPRPAFLLACDLPMVGSDIVSRVLQGGATRREGSGAWARVAAWDGRWQPLCALYSPGCGGVAATLLAAGRRSVHDLLARIDVEFVSFDDVTPDPFLNVNTPADYEAAGGAPAAAR
jgi:molybdopterin-guanine dinucleotide biosynthesis protein A